MAEITDLSTRRKPVHYTVRLTHHWDDTLEVFVEDVSDEERSKASIADSLRRAAEMISPSSPTEGRLADHASLLSQDHGSGGEGEYSRAVLLPTNEWFAEQARNLSSDKDEDSVGALAWNLRVAFRRWSDEGSPSAPETARDTPSPTIQTIPVQGVSE